MIPCLHERLNKGAVYFQGQWHDLCRNCGALLRTKDGLPQVLERSHEEWEYVLPSEE